MVALNIGPLVNLINVIFAVIFGKTPLNLWTGVETPPLPYGQCLKLPYALLRKASLMPEMLVLGVRLCLDAYAWSMIMPEMLMPGVCLCLRCLCQEYAYA